MHKTPCYNDCALHAGALATLRTRCVLLHLLAVVHKIQATCSLYKCFSVSTLDGKRGSAMTPLLGRQYGNWSGCYNETDPMTWECFWTDALAQKMFKAHMLKMVSRVNTVNGRLWRCAPSAPAAPADLRAIFARQYPCARRNRDMA